MRGGLDAAGWEPFDVVEEHPAWRGALLVQLDVVFVRKGGALARRVQESIGAISEHNGAWEPG